MKELWIALGLVTLVLGLIGIILPVLPTTPFILVTTYSFSKGSSKMSNWIKNSPLFSKYINNIQMTARKKFFLNITVDVILVIYMIIFKTAFLIILLSTLILVKHYVFAKYVKTV